MRLALTATALIPIILPAAYVFCLKRAVASNTSSVSGCRHSSKQGKGRPTPSTPTPSLPVSIPEDVRVADSDWVLAFERVTSSHVPVSDVADLHNDKSAGRPSPGSLLIPYSRAAQLAFSWTPQAFAIRSSIKEPGLRSTFEETVISGTSFSEGDIINGVYKVTYHGPGKAASSERVELVIEAPKSYKGPVPHGLIVSEVRFLEVDKDGQAQVVFINETWMWRREDESPTLIEGTVGGWLHTLLAGWLVLRGMNQVLRHKVTRL